VFGEDVAKKPLVDPPVIGVVFPDNEEDDAWVTDVDTGGPAAKAGIKPGDTITKINGVSIKSVRKFREVIKDQKSGEVVKFTIRRGKEILQLPVRLGMREPMK
jgi:serine protease Do